MTEQNNGLDPKKIAKAQQQVNELLNPGKAKEAQKRAMAKALNAFESVASKVNTTMQHYQPNIAERAKNNVNLHDALYTRPVLNEQGQNGVQMGERYGIFPKRNTHGKTRYEIGDMSTGQRLAEDLFLSDTAEAMVKYLNKGHSFYSPEIRNLLMLEDKYIKHYNDARSASAKAKEQGRDKILETRFEEAKTKALGIKQQIIEINSKI